jgi:ATP-dependent DNA ligase
MKFTSLATYFEKLETTPSRLALIQILSGLFKKSNDAQEISEICYLVQGRIAPFYEPVEIGMADKMVTQAIAQAYHTDKEKVWEQYQKMGDMGEVAQQFSLKVKGQSSKLSVEDVFTKLTAIAHMSGAGSVEKKITALSDLLISVDALSAKFLVRVPLGKLRMGIGDPTILDALVTAKMGEKTQRNVLEGAYNRTSDLGYIGKHFWTGGLKAVEKLPVTVGRPIRSELCERLPNPQKVIEKMGEVDAQYKYDGFRCVTGYTPIYVKEKGITVVRDLQICDKVLTKTGSFKPVLAIHKRSVRKSEKLFKFKTYLGEEIIISEGHPVLCLIEGQEVWMNIEQITNKDKVVFPLPIFPPNNPHPAPEKLELQTKSGYKKTFYLTDNFYRFLGFWIGDGFTNDFHNTERVGLTFNAKREEGLADFYENIVKQDLQVPQISRYVHNGGLNLYWRDEPLKHWLSTYFRREWVGKMLPEWFSHVAKEQFKKFLTGWIESDGHIDKFGITYITTKERDLAAFAQMIALSHGIVVGLHYVRIKNKTYYKLIIPKTGHNAKIENNRLVVKVLRNEEIIKRDPRVQLYDIQVEGDESFCVPMATLHNCQIHKNGNNVRIFSRNLEETTHMFPELIEATIKQVKAKTAILDGEAIAYHPASEEFLPFQETTKRRRKHNIQETAKELPLKAFIFDILYKNNKSLLDEPLTARLKIMQETIDGTEVLISAKSQDISDPKKLTFLLEEAISKGLEGLVVKKLNSPYEAGGRNFNWVKLKRHSSGELHDTIDCVILGYIYGKGKRAAFGAGALLVGLYDKKRDMFVTVTRIGTGLSDDEWRSIKEKAKGLEVDHKPARVDSLITPSVWVKPVLVIEVLADEITRSPLHTAGAVLTDGVKEPGYALRFPRLVSFRDKDKKAEDATSVDELIEMYQDQGKKE